jgi:large subunit ribosomal protein L17
MVTDLFRFDRIKTTDMKAKELRRIAEKLITLAKEGTLHKRRQAAAYIRDKEVLKKLFDVIAAKFKDRPGGYTRIIKLGFRKGDNTAVSIIELVEEDYKPAKKKKASPKKEKPKTAEAGVKGKPRAKSSKKESAEELGLIEEGKAAAEAPEPAPAPEAVEKAEEPSAEEPQAPEQELKASGAGEPTETTPEPQAETGSQDKKEE